MNQPIDLHGLHLIRLVAAHRGVTAAATAAGLSQSALTRQIQLIEGRLGLRLFERTTRKLSTTAAGELLLRETEVLPGLLEGTLRRLREEFLHEQKEIRVGVSRSVTLAHLPGLLHANLRRHPEVKTIVSHLPGSAMIEAVASCRLDLGVLCPPPRLPGGVQVTHRIADAFSLIAPKSVLPPEPAKDSWCHWALAQNWIAPPSKTRSRVTIDGWWEAQGLAPDVSMELDSFDMTVHLVALGMGVALVPRRTVSGFPRKRLIAHIKLPQPLERELAVIAPKRGSTPEHVLQFIGDILFS